MYIKKILAWLFFFAAVSFSLVAQTKDEYTAAWQKVAAFEKKGLTKSALQEVMNIYRLAVKDKNDAQQIKSSIYQLKYRQLIEEDSRETNLFYIDTLIAQAKSPAKNILQSMQAQLYWQYLQNNRYKFYNRTQLAEEKSKDISTWSLAKLHTTIIALYQASLDNDQLLKQTKLTGYDPIIIKGENTRHLRPTLFDFLAHRALDYYMNPERDLVKPAYHFTIRDTTVFLPAKEFVQAQFITNDTASLHYIGLKLMQDILQFHLADKNKEALLDADLIRLNYANQFSVSENKTMQYEAALKEFETLYEGNPAVAQAMYLRAAIYLERGQRYAPSTNTEYQFEIKRAKDICDAVIKKYPGSEGAINCQNLLNQVLQPNLQLETEKVNIPGQPFRTLVRYKNVQKVYFRIIKTTREQISKLDRRNYDKLWKDVVAMVPVKKWAVSMPDPLDYQEHSTEIKVDALGAGTYFILASIDADFSLEKNIIARQLTYISNIGYLHNNTNDYYVLHRDNGQPIPNTQVQVWETKYNYAKNEREDIKAETYITDKNGYFKLKETKEYRSFSMQLKTKEDELFLDENHYNNYYNSLEPDRKPITFLFTDRSIYRPGQIVYFKGIVLQQGKRAQETSILPAFNASIQLKDANGQKVSELKMKTNDFGSYHGSFKLPAGTLNGEFSLFDESTNTSQFFNVEEYKRPKFFVEVEKPSGTYRLFDSVRVRGNAKAYAGNNIDGAAVKYRVVRKVRFQPWWNAVYGGYARKIMPPGRGSDEVEISNGETITGSDGEFQIVFKALPDESIPKKEQPTFYYEVNVDITDLNGETRSGTTSIAVAYQALQLEIKIGEIIPVDSLSTLLVNSKNLNDIDEKTLATVTLQKLQSPNRIFRQRYWEKPDQFVMGRDEYYDNFPYDVYKDENEVKNYLVAEKVFEKSDSTNQLWTVANGALNSGWYKITAIAKDKYGEEVRAEKYIRLTDDRPSSKETEPITVSVNKHTASPGEQLSYIIKTAYDRVWLIHNWSKMDKNNVTSYKTIRADQPLKDKVIVEESDRGGMSLSYAFMQHNRFYNGSENISVPWTNKELDISYQTFRDKLLPGSKEKWTVKISGEKGEKVAAEMLAGMYDVSLDQFKPHNWAALNIWPGLYAPVHYTGNGFNAIHAEIYNNRDYQYLASRAKSYDQLLELNEVVVVGYGTMRRNAAETKASNALEMQQKTTAIAAQPSALIADAAMDSAAYKVGKTAGEDTRAGVTPAKANNIEVRKDFKETAFFMPDLKTDSAGNVSFDFTIPEALTEWKLMTFAHTSNLSSGYLEKTIITQKPLMAQPNAPRFIREGDRMEFSAKIVNMSEKEITGTAQLELLDAATNKPVDGWFKNIFPNQYFTISAGQSAAVKFPMEIPFNFNSAVTYRVTAISTGNLKETFSDGEEMTMPVLTNRMLVTESMPLNLRNSTSRDFKFDKLLKSNSSTTISNHGLTVEYSSNPAWYAVQALPYLMEYPYDCAEQIFNRYYANTLASHLTGSIPKIRSVFEKWKRVDTAALMSNLQKNEELKSALLQETPWVLQAQTESTQKKNIALLFDMVKMSNESEKAINQLKEAQSPNGGFVWFKGGPDDRYITQYILTGIGHLKKLNALNSIDKEKGGNIQLIISKAIPYLDGKIKDDYDNLVKSKAKLTDNNLNYSAIQYLYMRSFFPELDIAPAAKTAVNYYTAQAKKFWLKNNKYMQAMIALALHRNKDLTTPKAITRSLKENAIRHDELGMYWKEWTTGGYWWHQAPIESQALMVEVFTDIEKDQAVVEDLKTWLLKQKQTQNWRTTKATAEACYALLLGGNDWTSDEKEVTIRLGETAIRSTDIDSEAGTGYFKTTIEGHRVKPTMGNVSVSVKAATGGNSMSWGSVYWQYFEDLDKITPAATPLRLNKQVYIERSTDKGPQLTLVAEGVPIKVGDKIKVRIELKVDRDMEYVHMKDMRAACMEPVNVLSGYKYQGGLGYYESTKDASTNFFFGWLPRGSYVFEYALFVSLAGNFSNGITSIQSMYAPEFTSHSEGIRLTVGN